MKKQITFKELAQEEINQRRQHIKEFTEDQIFEMLVSCMEFVREKTLEEVADCAETDFNQLPDGEIEVYVIKESITGLPKNSVEV